MRPMCSAGIGEDHLPAHSANTTEPPTMMDPAPALDEAILDPGHHEAWGNTMKKTKQHLNTISKCRGPHPHDQ